MNKSLIAILLTITTSTYALDNLVNLNMTDAKVCRQQLLSSVDHKPIVIEYTNNHCPDCMDYKSVYQQVAQNHPERVFFLAERVNVSAEVKTDCLQETGFSLLPRTSLVWKNQDPQDPQISNSYLAKSGLLNVNELEEFLAYDPKN